MNCILHVKLYGTSPNFFHDNSVSRYKNTSGKFLNQSMGYLTIHAYPHTRFMHSYFYSNLVHLFNSNTYHWLVSVAVWSISDRVPPFLAPSRRTEKTSSLSSSWSCNEVKVRFFSLLPSRYIRYPDIGVTSNWAGVWYISLISLQQQKKSSHDLLQVSESNTMLKSHFM